MGELLDRLEAGTDRFNRIVAGAVAVSIGLFAVLIPLNLLSIRLGFGGWWWLYEAVEYTLYFGIFLGAPWVLRLGAHIRVDVFITSLPANSARTLDQLLNIAGAALCLLLFVYGTRSAIAEFADNILPDKDLRIPTGYLMVVFAFSFLMLTVEFLLRMRRVRAEDPAAGTKAGL